MFRVCLVESRKCIVERAVSASLVPSLPAVLDGAWHMHRSFCEIARAFPTLHAHQSASLYNNVSSELKKRTSINEICKELLLPHDNRQALKYIRTAWLDLQLQTTSHPRLRFYHLIQPAIGLITVTTTNPQTCLHNLSSKLLLVRFPSHDLICLH